MHITVLGGGVSIGSLVSAMAADSAVSGSTVVLHGRRASRLEAIARYCNRLLAPTGGAVTAETDLAEALRGADVLVNMVRVGGARARRHDEEELRWRGAPGDEGLGPGGVANAWRTSATTADLIDAIRATVPDVLIANLVAPLGVTTRHLQEAGLRCIGLCELPLMTRDRLDEAAAPPTTYVGSNHLGLHLPRTAGDLSELASAAVRASLASEGTVLELGGVPAPYFHRVLRPDLGATLGISATDGRAQQLASLSDRVVEAMSAGRDHEAGELLADRPTPWFDRSLVPALHARATGEAVHIAINGLNARPDLDQLVDWLPSDALVELVGGWTSREFEAEVPTEPRARSLEYLRAVAAADAATYAASLSREPSMVRNAMQAWEAAEGHPPSAGARGFGAPVPHTEVSDSDAMVEAVLAGGDIR